MSSKQDCGPAFPLAVTTGSVSKGFKVNVDEGMTLRDYFAGQALVGILANPNQIKVKGRVGGDSISMCYFLADAMLAERSKQ